MKVLYLQSIAVIYTSFRGFERHQRFAEQDLIVNRPRRQAKTLAEIAHLAGVSESTASRALHDSALIHPETRARVQATAHKLNYRPNWAARNLRLRTSNTFALVMPMDAETGEIWSDPFIFKFLGILGSTLHRHGYDLILLQTARIDQELDSRYFRSGRVDGFIYLGRGQDYSYLNEMAGEQVPFVVWGPVFPEQKYCSVGVDNIAAGRMVVRHLLNLGRRRIAIIADNASGYLTESNLRYQGYQQALLENGFALDANLFASATYSAKSGYHAMKRLLASAPDLDAVFVAYSDMVAIAAMQALGDAGRRIPDDVSIVGFDNIELAAFTGPPLTTVSQSLENGGIDLVIQKLIEQLAGVSPESVMLTAELVVRRSCGSQNSLKHELLLK